MNDIRALLARSTKVPQVNRRVSNYVMIHYNGPAFIAADVEQIKADARFHVNTRGWDGLAYHYAVGRDGTLYQCRDFIARLNHSGVPQFNSESLAVLVLTGEGMSLPALQVAGLEELLKILGKAPRYVLTHQEAPRLTACPGALLTRWINSVYRPKHSGAPVTAKTIVEANVRDEPNVLSHRVRSLPSGTLVTGTVKLGKPYKGDSLWVNLAGTSDYVHASVVGL